MKKLFIVTSIALLTSTAFAAEAGKSDTGVDYNELALNYISTDVSSNTLSGYGLNASYLLTENIFIGGGYVSIKNSSLTVTSTSGTLGYRMPLAATVDGFVSVGYAYGTAKTTSSTNSDSYPLALGIRAAVTPDIDLRASVNYTEESSDPKSGFAASIKYKINGSMFVNGSYAYSKGDKASTSYLLGVGIKF